MNNKRITSLLLSIIMLLQVLVVPAPIHAAAGGSTGVQKSEGEKISKRSEVFEFKNNEKPKFTWFSTRSMSLFGARDAGLTKSEKVIIETNVTGLDEGEKEFNWEAFGQNKKFEAWIEVGYDGERDDQGLPIRHKVSEVFDISQAGTINTNIVVDASKTVENYYIATEYDKEPDSFKINAFFEAPTVASDKVKKTLTFTLGVHQIVSTKITYNLIDEYGKAIDLNDANEAKPADNDLKGIGKIGDVTTFDLKKEGTDNLWQDQGLDEWDLMDSSLALSLTKNEIKSNNIDYKLTSTYDVIKGGTVTIKRQKDVVTPKDQHNPGEKPEGYARINLVADETGNGSKGTFNKDDSRDNTRVVDVKVGKPYTVAKDIIDNLGKPFALTKDNKINNDQTFKSWAPELNTLGTAAADETKTLNAVYKQSDQEIIPYLPGEPVPEKDDKGLSIPKNYVTVTFKSESATKGKVKIGEKEGATVLAKVKPGIDLSQKAEIKTLPAEHYGFTKWDPALTNAAADQVYTARFVKSGEEIGKNDPIPTGWYRVTVSQDAESIQAGTVETKYYPVQPGDKLASGKFVDLTGKANEGYKDPAWYVGSDKVEKPYDMVINSSIDFVARATELESHKITKENGLNPVDFTAYKGDEMGEGFWKKGVELKTADKNLQKLLDAAKVTDATTPARTTEKAGEQVGTLKVTFSDGSSIEVKDQKLTVIDTTVSIDYDKDAKAPRHKDEVVKGKIDSKETLEGAKVEILDNQDKVIGITLAKADGSFIAGTRELQAGETIKVRVTLPKADKASDAVEKVVGLNPDDLNNILPTADAIYNNFNGKPGVSKDKVDALKKAIDAGKALIDSNTKKPAASVKVDAAGQKSLDDAYANIKAAMEALTENQIPMINAPDHKEIFVGEDIDLDKGVTVADDNIKQVNGKDYSYKIYDASGAEVQKTAMVAKDGVYRVVYSAEDTQGVKASHTMTVVVKKTVVEVPGEFPTPTPEGYVKVEFKSGEHAGLNGVSKFLVKKDSPKLAVKEPKIVPMEGYKVADPKWSKEIPATFATDFETEAQVLPKTTTTEPEKDKDKYAKLTFEKGDHGEFETNAQTTIWVLKNEKVSFNAPEIKAADGFTFAGWEPKLKDSYTADQTHTAQYASNSDVSDVPVKGFQEVKFVSGTDGKFEGDKTEKSVWVRPGKLVDLRTKAPKVTVTTKGKSFIGWDQDLVQKFTKALEPTVINAKYDDTVKTTKPTENAESYAKVDFVPGNLGKIENNQTTTYWVVKGEQVTDTFKAPTVTAKDGWKVKTGNDAWSPAVATKYTQDTIHVAQYEYDGASVVPQNPGETKPNVPENFVKVEFKKGAHGVISSEETTVYWVDPTKPVTQDFKAPKVIADTNYKHDGWKPALTANQTFAEATDIVAQYKSLVVTEDPNDANYVTVEFKAGDHGTLTGDAKFWVYKNEKVSITAPTVTAKAGYTFDKWDPAVKTTYAEATVHNATYTTNNNVSDTEVEGFNKVTFKAGDHGTLTEKSVWVKPDTLVDLTDKAPAVTPEKGYSHIGWKPALVGKFENNAEIVAQYSNNISDTPVEGWTELTFDQGDHGKLASGAKNVKWVNPKAELMLKDIAPAIVADTNYTHTGWKDGNADVALETAQKFATAKTFTATYESDLSDTQKDGFVQVTFAEGDHGKFPKEAVKEIYVKKDVAVDLTEKAPTVIPNQGYGHSGWNPALKGTFSTVTTITAQYKAGTFDEKAIKEIIVVGPTKMGYGVGEKLDLTGLKVIAKDDAGLQKTYEGVEAITKAGFTITPADKTELKMEDNGKHIVVTKGEGNDEVTGQTETTLTIHENKSAKAENVNALNQNKVVDGKVTNEPKDTTTVTGKVKPGSTVIIKDENGKDITPNGGVKVENDGTFTAEVEKQDEGKKVQVITTEKGKQPADPADATVVRDADNNGVEDKKEKFDIKKATKVEIIKNPDKMEYLVKTTDGKAKFETKGLVVKFTDDSGKSETYTAEQLAKMEDVTIKPANNEEIGLTAEGKTNRIPLEISVNGKTNEVKPNVVVKLDADGNKIADEDEKTPVPDVTARNIGTDGPDGKKVPATKTTVEIKTEKNAKVTIEYTDKQGQPQKIETTAGADGKVTKEIQPKLEKDTPVTVTVKDGEKQPTEKTVKVFDDLDNDKKPDTEAGQTERPAAIASNKGKTPAFTTIEGKTEKGAVITVKVNLPKVGSTTGEKELKDVTVENLNVKDDGTYTLEAKYNGQPLENGAEILVYAENKPKTISEPQTTTVFNDTNNDGKPDGGKVDLSKIKDIQVIDPNKMTYVEGTDDKLNLAGLKVVVRDTAEGIQIFEYDTTTNKFKDGNTVEDGFTVKVEDKAVQQNTALTSAEHNNKKITVAYGEKSGETVQALKVTKTLTAPEVDDVKKGDKTVNVTVPKNGETKITVKVGDKEVVAEKDTKDGQWKVGNNPVDTAKGKLQIPVDELKQGDVVKVTTEDAAGNTAETEKQVPVDEYSKDPTDVKAKNDPATPSKTTITGKATKGAVITITDKDGTPLTTEPSEVKVDSEGNFTATIDKKDPNTLLLVKATEAGKEPSKDVPAQVEGSSDVVEKKPGVEKPAGFVTVKFAIKDADQAKGSLEGAKEYYVNPKVNVQLNPPTFKAATGYKLEGWDKKGQMTIPADKYTTDTTINAVIGEEPDIVDASGNTEKPAGYVEVRFGLDKSKAKFNDNAVTKYYVNPTKEIKLTAPGVTVTDLTYTFEGWDNDNWNGSGFNEAKYEQDTLITAKLKGSFVEKPQVGDVTTGDTKVDVNPGSADKVTVEVEGQGTVVVEKDNNGTWKTEDGTVVTPDGSGNLPIPVKPIGEKALVEVTVEKDGVVSEKVAKTAQKRIGLSVSNMEENIKGIVVQTYPAGCKVTISLNGEVLIEDYTSSLGILTAILKNPKKAGENYTIKAEMDGYMSEELTLPVIVK